jgi:hypothetical protein
MDNEVALFLENKAGTDRLDDARALLSLIEAVAGEPARMWGSSIVGAGRYHYRYDSGREGDGSLAAFSPRSNEFAIYLTGLDLPGMAEQAVPLLARLGPHRMGKACLYLKRLDSIDRAALLDLLRLSADALRQQYPQDE